MVVYANRFRSYGNLVIIENNEGFYCILSGMKNILISSGIEVLKGEPMAKLNTGKNSQLYFELRLNGKIVNPKSKVEVFIKKLHNQTMFKFLTYFFLILLNFSYAKSEDDKEVYKHLNLFGEAFEKIKNNYVESFI